MAVEENAIRSLLLVPDGAFNPKSGAGQRTAICFRALQQIGPVDVVILGDREKTGAAVFFPGAASVRYVLCPQFSVQPRTGLDRLRRNLNRFLRVDRLYRPDAQTAATLSSIVTKAHRIVLSRYAQPYCVAGLPAEPGRAVFVDIDDRDDQKFLTASQAVLGTGILARIFERNVIPKVRAQLLARLRDVQVLWYATPEDDLKIAGPAVDILRNVPYDVPDTPGESPASANQTVLFVGAFRHRPNQDGMRWFLKTCWADIRKSHPAARLRIVGLGAWNSIAPEFPDLEGVEYVGTVDDIAEEYARARVVISPVLEGGGSKIKVIEACAYQRPVVVSTHSARGFGPDLQALLPTAPDAATFASLCSDLLSQDALADRLAADLHKVQQAQFSQAATEAQIVNTIRTYLPV